MSYCVLSDSFMITKEIISSIKYLDISVIFRGNKYFKET